MSEHTKEPWDLGTHDLAIRIVSCVKACEGLSQDALDGGWKAREIISYARNLEIERDQLRARIAELEARQVVPEGWQLVPVKATREILEAIDLLCDNPMAFEDADHFWHYVTDWAPTPPAATRKYSGPGELERTGYIPDGSAHERECLSGQSETPTPPVVQPVPEPAAAVIADMRRIIDEYDWLDLHPHVDVWADRLERAKWPAQDAAYERQRCLSIIRAYQVPVGNSAAGEMAADWTMDALRAICAEIEAGTQQARPAQDVEPIPGTDGLYVVTMWDKWDGEGCYYTLLARKDDDGEWRADESGKKLIQHVGDEVVRVWSLYEQPAQDVARDADIDAALAASNGAEQ